MNENYQPGTLAPLIPEPNRPRKSKKGLWIGLAIGVVALLCITTVSVGVIERNRITTLVRNLGSKNPISLGSPNLQVENDTWQVKFISVGTSSDALYDSQGNYISPKSGFIFLVVKTTLVNKSTDSKTFSIGLGAGDALVTDDKGNTYPISAIQRNSSTTLNLPGTFSTLYIYPDAPDGEATDFYFAVPTGTKVVSFKYMDMSPLTPLPGP